MATVLKSINPNTPNPKTPKSDRSNSRIYLLKLCKHMRELHQIHATLIKTGQIHDIAAINAIIEFSAISDSARNLHYAESVFEKTENPSLFAKNLMIRGHSQSQDPIYAIYLYVRLLNEGFEFNKFAFSFLIQACTISKSIQEGHQIHGQILKFGEIDPHLASSIIRFYSEVPALDSARRAFESSREFMASWNSIIDGYSKLGEMEIARRLFDEMPQKSLISWTALITGYVHLGRFKEALEVFQTMQKEGFNPDQRTLAAVLPSISHLGALNLGKWVHSYIENLNLEVNIFLGSALLDMYCKCGCIESAIDLFQKMGNMKRNVVTWNAMINGLAMHGRGSDALELFQEMLVSGTKPTDVTFVGVLRACSHVGMVNEGMLYFDQMRRVYGILPTVEHYGCMVDLLGRAGQLEEAEKLTKSMIGQPDVVVMKTLLGACRVHGNVEIGEGVGWDLIELAPNDCSCFVLLSNLYASVGKWQEVGRVRNLMKERGVEKIAGCSSIELGNVTHEFHAGDMSHPRIEEIYAKVEEIGERLKGEGYTPDITQVLVDIDEEEKEKALLRHSEKLAIAFGLINMTSGITIRVVKNLRVCSDCHSVTKLISKLYDREIIVRDQNRFHHFKEGLCSCNDFW